MGVACENTCLISCLTTPIHCTESNHTHLLNATPSALDFLSKFLKSGQVNNIHIALWVTTQFTKGSK